MDVGRVRPDANIGHKGYEVNIERDYRMSVGT